MSSVDTSTYVGVGEVEAVAATVDDLVQRTGGPATALWPSVRPWLRHAPGNPVAVVVHRGERVVAAARLSVVRRAGLTTLTVLGRPEEPAWLPALDADAADSLAAGVVDHVLPLVRTGRPWRLRFAHLPTDDAVVQRLHARLPVTRIDDDGACVQLTMRDGAPLREYLSRNTRQAVAAATNRMERDGLAPKLEWLAAADDVADRIEEILQVHRSRNLQVRGEARIDSPGEREMFVDTVLGHARDGRCRMLGLRLDDRLAAFAIALISGDTAFVYANLVSPDWLPYSAGRVVNAELVRGVHDDPALRRIDWGPGPERHKMSGGGQLRAMVALHAWSSPLTREVTAAAGRTREALSRR